MLKQTWQLFLVTASAFPTHNWHFCPDVNLFILLLKGISHTFACSCVDSHLRPFIHPFICPFVLPFMRAVIHSFFH